MTPKQSSDVTDDAATKLTDLIQEVSSSRQHLIDPELRDRILNKLVEIKSAGVQS